MTNRSTAEWPGALETIDVDARFDRQTRIPGWSQETLQNSKVMVAGAGALGNETLKNLVLLGVGTLGIIDHDRVEISNLSRSVLFREYELGRPKAHVAASRLAEMNPGIALHPMHLDLTQDLGAGVLSKYDLVLGCLDNIEARWKLNRLCQSAGVPWIDAGIEGSTGQIAFFEPGPGPCYECGMTASMWHRMHERRSCLLAQQKMPERRIATTAPLAALVSSLQTQEAVAQLHQRSSGDESTWSTLRGGDRLMVSVAPYAMSVLHARRSEECLADHEVATPAAEFPGDLNKVTARQLLEGTGAYALDLTWDIALRLDCPLCGPQEVCYPAWKLSVDMLPCPACTRQRTPIWQSRIERDTPAAARTLASLGIPPLSVINLVTSHGLQFSCQLSGPQNMRG